ncbi:hypothetical protein GCM10028798_05730 [Humibacter antri]
MTTTNPVGKRARRLAAREASATDVRHPEPPQPPAGEHPAPHPPPSRLGSSTLTAITTADAVDDLAHGLYDEHRTQPWVVVTTPFESGDPHHDVDALVEQVGSVARVFTVETGALTHRLSDLLPLKLGVFGGAGRSFPVGFSSATTIAESMLRFPSTAVRRGPERLSPDPHATDRLAADTLTHAYGAGLFVETHADESVRSGGTVTGVAGSRAIVDLDSGEPAAIAEELTYPPIPLSWVVAPGQRVTGVLDRGSHRLGVELPTPGDAELTDRFAHHGVTLVLVLETDAGGATLALHPRLRHNVTTWDISHNRMDRADGLLSPGDVVPARVQHLSDGTLHLSLWDVDDDEPIVPPLALTAGGPPWLAEGRPLPVAGDRAAQDARARVFPQVPAPGSPSNDGTAFAPTDAEPVEVASGAAEPVEVASDPAAAVDVASDPSIADAGTAQGPIHAVPGPGPRPAAAAPDTAHSARSGKTLVHTLSQTIAARDAKLRELQQQLRSVGTPSAEVKRLRGDLQRLELTKDELAAKLSSAETARIRLAEQLRATQKQLRGARRTASTTNTPSQASRRERGPDDESWLRHEVLSAWVARVPASDKQARPIPDPGRWAFGPDFATSLEKLDDGQFDKVIRRIVDIVTSPPSAARSWNEHALRSGVGGDDPAVVRADGARSLRVEVERNTPSARRLHYWRLPDGGVEFSRVVVHDDMTP